MTAWEVLLLIADVWMTVVGFWFGVRFIRNYRSYLIGLEWIIMGASGTNVIVHSAIKAGINSPTHHLVLFFDAFSRSIGFTLLVVLGLMKLTHRFEPPVAVDVGAFVVGAALGYALPEYAEQIGITGKIFFLVAGLAASGFLAYFAYRLGAVSERTHAWWTGVVAAMNVAICSIYDFWHIPGDDANHSIFYTFALFTWGLTMLVIYYAYAALDAHNKQLDAALIVSQDLRTVDRA